MAWVISAFELVRMSMSSAKAKRSPLFTMSLSFWVYPRASSRYTLKSMGDKTPPWTTPRSAEKAWLPMMTFDSWYILMMRRAKVSSCSFLHLLRRILQSFSRLTVS
jgi:hypothetical protein